MARAQFRLTPKWMISPAGTASALGLRRDPLGDQVHTKDKNTTAITVRRGRRASPKRIEARLGSFAAKQVADHGIEPAYGRRV